MLMPSLFISHGAPDLPLAPSPAREFLKALPSQFPTPTAILVISAHWLTRLPTLSTAPQPATLYDFAGFAPELYTLRYPAPGALDVATQAAHLLTKAGFSVATDPTRGLDHGAWNPLLLMYPHAEIPVLQLSLQPQHNPEHHWRLGQALRSLRHAGVLILASGAATHNLGALGSHTAEPPTWVTDFGTWLIDAVTRGDRASLFEYHHLAPQARRNHPTPEHLLPLFVALGASEGKGQLLHSSYTYQVLHMSAFAFQ